MTGPALHEAQISLVIPTYNRARLVVEAVESALRQSRPFAKIVVVDDGSEDCTQKVLAAFADKIEIVRTRNAGVQAARNSGVARIETPFVAFADSDDILDAKYVETISGWLPRHPMVDIVYCNFVEFGEFGTSADKFSEAPSGFFAGARDLAGFLVDIPDLYARTTRFQPLYPTGMTVKAKFFANIGGYDQAFRNVGAEDYEFTLRAISRGSVALCPRPLARIRKHAGNDSRDSLRQIVGEAAILEHGLACHPGAGSYRGILDDAVRQRYLHAFNQAFARADFTLAATLQNRVRPQPTTPNYLLKKLITGLPPLLRQPIWRLSQMRTVGPAEPADRVQR